MLVESWEELAILLCVRQTILNCSHRILVLRPNERHGYYIGMKTLRFLVAAFLLLSPGLYVTAQQPAGFVPVTDAMLQNPDPADWLMWRRTLNGWGYSPLDQINRRTCAI